MPEATSELKVVVLLLKGEMTRERWSKPLVAVTFREQKF
jgi:hypothetical protein